MVGLLRETVILLVLAVGLAVLFKTFLIQAFYIPSGSMLPTLEISDRVLVEKLSYVSATSSAATWWCSSTVTRSPGSRRATR